MHPVEAEVGGIGIAAPVQPPRKEQEALARAGLVVQPVLEALEAALDHVDELVGIDDPCGVDALSRGDEEPRVEGLDAIVEGEVEPLARTRLDLPHDPRHAPLPCPGCARPQRRLEGVVSVSRLKTRRK